MNSYCKVFLLRHWKPCKKHQKQLSANGTSKLALVTVSPTRLVLRRKTSDKFTITVLGEDDCPVTGQKVTVKISKAGKKRMGVVLVATVTDNNGEAKFIVIALKKTGSARIFFKIGSLRISVPVKVVK